MPASPLGPLTLPNGIQIGNDARGIYRLDGGSFGTSPGSYSSGDGPSTFLPGGPMNVLPSEILNGGDYSFLDPSLRQYGDQLKNYYQNVTATEDWGSHGFDKFMEQYSPLLISLIGGAGAAGAFGGTAAGAGTMAGGSSLLANELAAPTLADMSAWQAAAAGGGGAMLANELAAPTLGDVGTWQTAASGVTPGLGELGINTDLPQGAAGGMSGSATGMGGFGGGTDPLGGLFSNAPLDTVSNAIQNGVGGNMTPSNIEQGMGLNPQSGLNNSEMFRDPWDLQPDAYNTYQTPNPTNAGSFGSQPSFLEQLSSKFANRKDPLSLFSGLMQMIQNQSNAKDMKNAFSQFSQGGFPHSNFYQMAQQYLTDPAKRYEMVKGMPGFQAAQNYVSEAAKRRNAHTGDLKSGYGDSLMANVVGQNAKSWDDALFGQIAKASGMDFNPQSAQAYLASNLLPNIYNMRNQGNQAFWEGIRRNQGYLPELFQSLIG
jgi:hypothetical protein